MTLDEVIAGIHPADESAKSKATLRQAKLTKPPGSLGQLEDLSIRLAGIFGAEQPTNHHKTVIIAAADHGVMAQNVTGYPQEVTAQMVLNFLSGGAAINAIARTMGVELVVVDAGVATPLPAHPQLRVAAGRRSTNDITKGPAMSRGEAESRVLSGVSLAKEAIDAGTDILGIGDMGIGNTTPSSAITSALIGRRPSETTGQGTGRTDAQLAKKIATVERAIEVNHPDPSDGMDVLTKVGGFEIAVLAGVILGSALYRRPLVLDGFISGAAALIAQRVCPNSLDFMIAGHQSAEYGHRIILEHLGLSPLINLDMRLGEGTGAALAMPLVEASAACLNEMATFEEASVSNRLEESDTQCGV